MSLPKCRQSFVLVALAVLASSPAAIAQSLVGMAPQYMRDNKLYVIDPTNAAFIGGVAVRLSGFTVVGSTGLATHPVTGELWGLLLVREDSNRYLVKINPANGLATMVGNTSGGNRRLAGLAFNADGSILYGVIGDGGSNPESLVTVDQSNGTTAVLCPFGNGDDGEIIALNPENGVMYHGSGNGTQVFETIDNLGTCAVTNIPLSGDISEFMGLVYSTAQHHFLVTGFNELFSLTPTGTVNLIGAFTPEVDIKGLTIIGNAPQRPPCPPFAPLYASTTLSSSSQSMLWAIDPSSGASLFVGLIGFERVGALAFGPDNRLYGIGERLGTSTNVLIVINPCTGQGTEIGLATGLNGNATDLSFRGSDQALFAYSNNNNLVTINTATGAATLIGPSGLSNGGNAIAFSPANVLFHSDSVNLNTLDQATGAPTVVSPMTFPPGPANPFIRAGCMDFRPGTSDLYAIINEYDNNQGQNDQWYLGTINTATAVVTKIGQTLSNADGMAFAPPGPDGDFVLTEIDNCPNTFNPGQENADGDSVGDACDECPNDAAKVAAGTCGCGVAEVDTNGNGILDCLEQAPQPQPTPQHVVDRNVLRTFLSFFFGVPICATGIVSAVPLSLLGMVSLKVWRRRRSR